MTNLRKYAEGKVCQIRIPGFCNFNPETTVLAHLRQPGITGVGQKAPDLLGAHGCSTCHGIVDGHIKTDLERDYVRMLFLEGMARTQNELVKAGKVKW